MNLLDKIWFGLLIIVTLTIFSCEDAHDIGLGLDPEGLSVKVSYTEIPLTATNIRVDSIKTSNERRLLIGKNVDPTFGTITSSAYSRLTFLTAIPSSSIYDSDLEDFGKDPIVYDSIVLNLDIKKVHSDNILPTQSFEIHQLEDTLFAGSFYLSDFDVPYNSSSSEGTISFTLSESEIGYLVEDDSTYLLSFKLNDSMGQKLMDYVKDESVSLNASTWYDYKGIAIVPDPANTALIGISPNDSTSIKIHYHIQDYYEDNGIVKDSLFTALTMDITLGGSGLYYSKIITDRSGSLMAAEKGDYNEFSVGDGNIYLQPASGIFPKVDLSPLVQFFDQNPNIQVNRLEFAMETSENDYFYSNVPEMRLMYADKGDGEKVNVRGLLANQLIGTAILTDNGYLSGTSEILSSELDDISLIYGGIPTLFGQLVENKSLEVDHIVLMPADVTTPDFSVFDEETGFRIKLYYTLPD